MTEKLFSELGKLVIDLLIGFERLQYTSVYDKVDNPNSVYLLYAATMKLIGRVVGADDRVSRVFRLKYHHILSNESVDEYLFHCLSKILADLLEIENNYQRFIEPVAELHMKLMSILTTVQLRHEPLVLANRRVVAEIARRTEIAAGGKSIADQSGGGGSDSPSENGDSKKCFIPIYFLPICCSNKKLKRNQSLTFHAIHSHYSANHCLDAEIVDILLDFDNAFAEFELDFVCQVNKNSIFSTHRAELTMDVAVLFSEAVQWAHGMGLLQYRSIGDCDIEIMVGIPRLAVLYGCIIARDGPLSEWSLNCCNEVEVEERLAPVFQDHRQELCRLRRQLNVLNPTEVNYLCQLLVDHNELTPAVAIEYCDKSCLSSFKSAICSSIGGGQSVSGDMHALFKLVSSVSDQMQSQHASDYRFFMETVFKIYKNESDHSHSSLSSSFAALHHHIYSESIIEPYDDDIPPCFTVPNETVEEAVDALAFSLSAQSPSLSPTTATENYSQLPFLSQWDSKACPSSMRVLNSQSCLSQPASVRCSSLQIIDHNLQPCRPQWRSDAFFPRCCHCERNFNVFRRKHHCRRCGYLFCSSCWGSKLALPALGIQNKVSICIECEEFLNGKSHQQLTSSTQSTS